MKPMSASEDTIVQEVTIDAPADRIFDALTRPAELVKWWGVEGKFQATKFESDLRPGGKWRMHVRGFDGKLSTVAGEYRKIERPRLLAFTWMREQENMPETMVQWELEEKNGLTTVRMTHSGLTSDHLRKRHSGWPMILDLLKAHAERSRQNTEPQSGWPSAYIDQFEALLKEPAKAFALLIRISVKDGTQAQIETAFAAARVATLNEPGVVVFDLNRDATDATRYIVYEQWKSLADLEFHLRTPYISKLKSEVDEVLAAPPEFNVLVPTERREP